MSTKAYTYNTFSSGSQLRKVDLYVMGTPALTIGDALTAPLTFQSETGGRVAAGLAKLMQKVAITLLSSVIPYDPGWGTPLSKYIIGGASRREITQIIMRSVDYVGKQLSEPATLERPLDEQLSHLTVSNISYNRDSISIRLRIDTYAETTVELVLPLEREPTV